MRLLNSDLPSVDQLAFSPDGQRLLAAGSRIDIHTQKQKNRGIHVWDLSSEQTERLIPEECVDHFCLHPQGRWLYYSGNTRPNTYWHKTLDLDSLKTVSLGLNADFSGMAACARTGDWMIGVVRSQDFQTQRLLRWAITQDRPPVQVQEFTLQNLWVGNLVVCPDGMSFASFEFPLPYTGETDYRVCLRNAISFAIEATTKSPSLGRGELLISPCGEHLLFRASRSFFVWPLSNIKKKPRKVTIKTPKAFTAIAFHPSSRFLAATNNDSTVRFVDTTSWDVSATYAWDIGGLKSIAFSPDGSLGAVGSDTGKIVVWDVDL